MKTGDQVTLTNGQTVKVNSVDMTRNVFDYLDAEETTEASFGDLADDAANRADTETPTVLQGWGRETTFFRLDDGSVLTVSGRKVNSYADDDSVRIDYPGADL